jgi:hypothetical protein
MTFHKNETKTRFAKSLYSEFMEKGSSWLSKRYCAAKLFIKHGISLERHILAQKYEIKI